MQLAVMNILQFVKMRKFVVHFLFWIFVWIFYRYFFAYSTNNSVYGFWFSSLLIPTTIITTYLFVYFLIPKFLLKKKYFKFGLYSFYALIISADILGLTIAFYFLFLADLRVGRMPFMGRQYVFVLVMVYLVVGLVSFISLLSHNFKTISKNKELQNKILDTQLQIKNQELQYLKKQIHPHFLFNTLNTIYGFALKQSKDTPEIILKLSNLLDYILYQVSKPKVSLKEEVFHIKEYIELEKMRFQDTLKISFYSDEIPDKVQVSPMLLIPFVENAFKHGDIVNGSLTVAIHIKTEEDVLFFRIENTSIKEGKTNNGIGLENIEKRLEMLFANSYTLETNQTANYFKVKLTIRNLKQFKNE